MADAATDAANELLVREFYGPVMLGTILATFLYGVNLSQCTSYLHYRKTDAWLTQAMVAVLFTMCTLQAALSIYTVWFFSVENFGNYNGLLIQSWATTASLGILMSFISVSTQQYFIWRVKVFSKSWLLFSALSLCSIAASAMGFLNASTSLAEHDPVPLEAEFDMVQATLAINVFVNVMDAGLLLYYLLKHRTGFKHTDTVIRRLVITCLESPLLNALASLIDMIVFKTTFPTNWSLIVAIPLGQIYTLSILALLNSRASLRSAWNGVTDIDAEHLERHHGMFTLSKQTEPVRVGVTVEHHAQVEVDPFAPRSKEGRGRSKRVKANSSNTGTTSVESVVKRGHDVHEMDDFSLAVHALNQHAGDDEKIAAVA